VDRLDTWLNAQRGAGGTNEATPKKILEEKTAIRVLFFHYEKIFQDH
jgi:hypothetical protein